MRLKPIEVLTGEISEDMLNADGLLDFENQFGSDVKVPNRYIIYLRKETPESDSTKTAPFKRRYDFTLLNDDEN